jgi:hypothetical protein
MTTKAPKAPWIKSPSVMTGGKPYFYLLPARPYGYWSVAWHRLHQCWIVENRAHQTVGLSPNLEHAKAIALRFWLDEQRCDTIDTPIDKIGKLTDSRDLTK